MYIYYEFTDRLPLLLGTLYLGTTLNNISLSLLPKSPIHTY